MNGGSRFYSLYGSSSFGIVVVQFVDGQLQILHAEEYKRPDFNEMLQKVWDLLVKYSVQKVMIDLHIVNTIVCIIP